MGKHRKKQAASSAGFDEAALAQLTSKIDQNLSKAPDSVPNSKRKRQDGSSNAPNPKKRQIEPAPEETRKGDEKKGGRAKKSKGGSGKLSRDDLLAEIRALGGDEEDLELVENIDSDAEEGGPPKAKGSAEGTIDDAFKNELAKFASSLGFENLPQDVASDDEDPEDEDEEEVEDEEEEEEEQEEISEPVKTVKEKAPTKQELAKAKKGKLNFEPRADWHALSIEGLPTAAPQEFKIHSAAVNNLKAYAKTLLDEDAAMYSAGQISSSTQRFMSTIISSGTLTDKISALTLAAQESPIHNIKALESLIILAGKKSRGQAVAALGALVDLLGNGNVLPSDRRLRTFASQPGVLGVVQEYDLSKWQPGQNLPGNLTKAHLIAWAFEDWLKEAYFKIIQLLEVWCNDEIEYSRMRAVGFIFALLKDKPEQEANLLRLLVNKLGDRERKLASRASYLLLQLLNIHPGMKPIIINSVEQEILLRPGQTTRAKYYAINTLNQTILSSKEPSIADNLVRIYFDIFMSLLKTGSLSSLDVPEDPVKEEKGKPQKRNPRQRGRPEKPTKREVADTNDEDSAQKLVSAVLTGVNRAIPFTTTDDPTLEKYLDTLYKITHSSNFNTSIQALMLIQQLASKKHLAVERFYRTLYESLLDPRLVTSSKQALYLNLLFRSLKNDVDVRRVKAFVKRMMQVINLHHPSFACGILFMIAELEGTFPDIKSLLNDPEEDDEEEVYKDVVDDDAPNTTLANSGANGSEKQRARAYDGRKRDPEYSNAEKSCLWELVPFLSHFHPSVNVFASHLSVRQKSLPKPELANHSLIHFLDKFVYRNPKSSDNKHGGSIMQPVLAAGSSVQVVVPGKASATQQSVLNSASFWNLKQEQVAAEDVFFHEYYTQVGKPGQAAKAEKAKKKREEAGSDDEEAEDEIWDALVNSKPDIEGDMEDDSDVDMEGYEDDSDEDLDIEGGADDMELESSGSDDGFEGIFADSDDEQGESGAEDDEDAEEGEEDKDGEAEPPKAKLKSRLRRKELKSLPTFASAEDYAEMLAAEENGLDDY